MILILSTAANFAQVRSENIDIGDLMGELVITKKTGSNMQQVWVLPSDYWEISIAFGNFALGMERNSIIKLKYI